MILCLTPNLAIDRTLLLPSLIPGAMHRTTQTIVAAGGKRMNVARALRTLGSEPLCMGFLGGHSGRLLADLAKWDGLEATWTWTDRGTRTCTILLPQGEVPTVIYELGNGVPAQAWERLRTDVLRESARVSIVCISGSLPFGSKPEDFSRLLRSLVDAGKTIWVDTSGPALQTALACGGLNIKVNREEIGENLGIEVHDKLSALRAAHIVLDQGMNTVILTLGADGAVLATRDGDWFARPPAITALSSVGSDDSFLAGLVSALESDLDTPHALRCAIAAGAANALSPGGGKFHISDYYRMYDSIFVEKVF